MTAACTRRRLARRCVAYRGSLVDNARMSLYARSMASITGPTHPLLRIVRDADQAPARHLTSAAAALAAHRRHAVSDQSVVRYDGEVGEADAKVTWMGPNETHRHLLGIGPDYLAVTGRTRPIDLARQIARYVEPNAVSGQVDRARTLIAAAEAAAPMVAVLLVVCLRAEMVRWDTGESVQGAAWRLALDAGHRLLGRLNPALPTPAHVWAEVADALHLVERPAADYARAYLDDRAELDQILVSRDIRWGGRTLTRRQVADRAGIAEGTWDGYVSRTQAPAADGGGEWRAATVDAWRLTRTTSRHTEWWTTGPSPTGRSSTR